MWASILQRHFPSSSWKKYYSKIIFYLLSVFHGLKPSFLWDIGPQVTASQVFDFVKECKLLLKNNDCLLIICVSNNIFITNVSYCLKSLSFEKFIVEIEKESFRLLKSNDSLKHMVTLLKNKFEICKDCEIWDLRTTEIDCPPCFFGLLLNYPLVYYFDCDFSPFSVKLKVYKVMCKFEHGNVTGRFQVFAFSVPQSVLDIDIDNFISSWYNSIQFSGKDIFSNLSLESSFEEVDEKGRNLFFYAVPIFIRCGLLKEAAHYFRKCLTINPYFIRAARNLENVSNLAVERWHFRMLNDQHRNEAFREAIIKKTRQGFHRVLDVGTGTGILSLFSSEGKAKEIYACDSSPTMIEIAQHVLQSNNVSNVKLINKHSSELQIPGDIHEKVSLLVTETFDSGLLGEGILETLSHAWEQLLLPPHRELPSLSPSKCGLIIPFGATVYATGIELDAVANDLHLKRWCNSFLLENCNLLRICENYDTQDLSRSCFKCLTGTERISQINFNNPDELTVALRGWHRELTLECKTSGRLDCFAVWFDLALDEDIVLSTSPLSEANVAWDPAIFPLPRSVTVEEKQNITVNVDLVNSRFNITLKDFSVDEPKFEASEEVIRILNNDKLGMELHRVANQLARRFENAVAVLDCHSFPVFGLNFLTFRRDRFRDEMTCFVPTQNDRCLVNFVAEKLRVKVNVVVKTETSVEDFLQGKKFDIILLDPIETTGEAKDEVLLQFNFYKSLLKTGGIILPECIEVIGQFIYSDWLSTVGKVANDSVTCGYSIAKYINVYQVQHFIDLDLRSIGKVSCSEPFHLCRLLDNHESVTEMTIPRNSSARFTNALAYWFRIKFIEGCDGILTNDHPSYHQVAILLSKTELSENIKFSVIRNNGLFSIELLGC